MLLRHLQISLACQFVSFIQVVTTKMTGEPKITCGKEAVHVSVPINSPFKGHVFVRGYYSNQKCHKDYRSFNDTDGELLLDIGFEDCGMRRKRQIKCLYMEEQQVVQSDVKVSSMEAAEMTMKSPMPICQYQVLDSGPNGKPIRSLNLGDTIYHSWECRWTPHKEGIYCMLLHSCTADDGHGSMEQIIDNNGCSMDEEVFPQIQYLSNLAAGTLMKAFKFADNPSVFFQCQINLSLAVNHGNGTCPRPECSRRNKRSIKIEGSIIDVSAPPLLINELNSSRMDTGLVCTSENDNCLQKLKVLLAVSLFFLLYLAFAAICFLMYLFRKRQNVTSSVKYYY